MSELQVRVDKFGGAVRVWGGFGERDGSERQGQGRMEVEFHDGLYLMGFFITESIDRIEMTIRCHPKGNSTC